MLDLPDGVDPPNIYHFVLDFYDREDQLEQLTGFDNSPFLDDLESRGFQVADEAVASYPITASVGVEHARHGLPGDRARRPRRPASTRSSTSSAATTTS